MFIPKQKGKSLIKKVKSKKQILNETFRKIYGKEPTFCEMEQFKKEYHKHKDRNEEMEAQRDLEYLEYRLYKTLPDFPYEK